MFIIKPTKMASPSKGAHATKRFRKEKESEQGDQMSLLKKCQMCTSVAQPICCQNLTYNVEKDGKNELPTYKVSQTKEHVSKACFNFTPRG
jgi:hypothetical protein